MKALNKLIIGSTFTAMAVAFAMGSYNSMIFNDVAFMSNDSGIKFAKRLDEMNGKVTRGRMAASVAPIKWESFAPKKAKVEAPKKIVKKEISNKVADIPEPAITVDLPDLVLTGGIINKKAIKQGDIVGSAEVIDGTVRAINFEMPDGSQVEINTKDRMVGNVFEYEDTATRELKSGLIYEVKEGVYMITLASDSQYPNTRLEFKVEGSFPENTQLAEVEENYSEERQYDDEYAQNELEEKQVEGLNKSQQFTF